MNSSLPPPIPRHVEVTSNNNWGPSQWISVSFAGLMFLFLVSVVVLLTKDCRSTEVAQQGENEAQFETSQESGEGDVNGEAGSEKVKETNQSSGENNATAFGEGEFEGNEQPTSGNENSGLTGSPVLSDPTADEFQGGQRAATLNEGSPTDGPGELELRVNREGGETGEIQVTLIWNTLDDLDLYVVCPSGETISFENTLSQCGGELDIDMNANRNRSSSQPVENVFWKKRRFPIGRYKVFVHQYKSLSGSNPTNFKLGVKIGEKKELHDGNVSPNQKKLVTEFSVP